MDSFSDCPANSNLLLLTDSVECSVLAKCRGVQCCVDLDFHIARLMLKTWLALDECQYTFTIGFENWSKQFSLLQHDLGSTRTETVGDYLSITCVLF